MTYKSIILSIICFLIVLLGLYIDKQWEQSKFLAFLLLLLIVFIIPVFLFVLHGRNVIPSFGFLFFLSIFIFILARPIIGFISGNESIFYVTFGYEYSPSLIETNHLVLFWVLLISAFYSGYFIIEKKYLSNEIYISQEKDEYFSFLFKLITVLYVIFVPLLIFQKVSAFLNGGYGAIYSSQTEYRFDFSRIVDFIIPLMFSLYICLGFPQRFKYIFYFSLSTYILSSLFVGQRGALGAWLLTFFWVKYGIQKDKIPLLKWAIALLMFILSAQFFEAYRSELDFKESFIVDFFINQGMTFFIPYFYTHIPNPSIFTKIFSILPGGSLAQLFDVNAGDASNLSRYISSSISQISFEQGFGLGSSAFIEIYSLSNSIFVSVVLVFFMGVLIAFLERKAYSNMKILLYFSMIFPFLMLLPRGSIYTLLSQLLYSFFIIKVAEIFFVGIGRKNV